jgi:hypothetical protein
MSMVKGITAQYELLPAGRNPYYQSFLPQKTISNQPVRKAAAPTIIDADTVILDSVTEWRETAPAEVPSRDLSISERISEERLNPPPFFWLLALKAYENQMPAFIPTRASGLQVNLVA